MSTEWPTWARILNLDSKWAKDARTLEIDGVEYLVVDSYGLNRSAVVALVADATEHNFRLQVLPHPKGRNRLQVLVWKD